MKVPTFQPSRSEFLAAKKWIKVHKCGLQDPRLASITWSFTPTGIGEVVMVECSCGQTMDVTDYGNW